MKPQTILLDLDSIIVDIEKTWYPEYNAKYQDDLTIERILHWNVHEFCRQDLLGVDHPVHPVYRVIEEPGFFLKPAPVPGAVEGVKKLVDAGYNTLIVTAATGHALSDKYHWVQKNLPFFPVRKKFITAHEKGAIRGDIAFDDGPHNIEAYRAANPDMRIATIKYPYNVAARPQCDLVAGSYREPAVAWKTFVDWVLGGALRYRPLAKHDHEGEVFRSTCRACQDGCCEDGVRAGGCN